MDFNVFKLDVITTEVIEFYKSNLGIAKKQYEELIDSAKPRGLDKTVLEGYYEIHHIKARCMGGEDIKDNLVLLTYKEHIIAHLLLFIINPEVIGLRFAFFMLTNLKDVKDSDSDLYIDLISLEYIRSETYNSPEFRKMQSELVKNAWKDPEYRKIQSELAKNRWKDPEYRERKSKSSKNMWKDSEYRERKSELTKNQWKDPEFRERMSNMWKDPEFRKMQSELAKNRWKDPEYRERKSKSSKNMWKDPEFRKIQSELTKNQWKDPKFREMQSNMWKDPEFRKMQSELAKNRWKDPEYREKIECKQGYRCISPDNIEYKSITEASKSLNISCATLSRWIKKGKNGWKRVKKS